MANLHVYCLVISSLLLSFASRSFGLHTSSLLSSPQLSFELHLSWPPSNSSAKQHPLTPYLLSNQPLLQFDESSNAHAVVGGIHGLFLAEPAASMEIRHAFLTATLQKANGSSQTNGATAETDKQEGSLIMVGSLDSGAMAVVGGTRSFAFASGVVKVSITAPDGKSDQRIFFMEVELQAEGEDSIDFI